MVHRITDAGNAIEVLLNSSFTYRPPNRFFRPQPEQALFSGESEKIFEKIIYRAYLLCLAAFTGVEADDEIASDKRHLLFSQVSSSATHFEQKPCIHHKSAQQHTGTKHQVE